VAPGLALSAEEAVAGFLFEGPLALGAGAALLAQLLGLVELGGFAQGEGAAQGFVELALLAQQRLQVGGLGIEVALAVAHEVALLQEPRGLAGEELGRGRGAARSALGGQRVPGSGRRPRLAELAELAELGWFSELSELGGQVLQALAGLLELALGLGLAATGELELQAEAPQLLLGVGLGAPAQGQDERGDLGPPGTAAKRDARACNGAGNGAGNEAGAEAGNGAGAEACKNRRRRRGVRGALRDGRRRRRLAWRLGRTHFFHYA